jgi:predicted nucleotidyltransferase
MGMKKGRARRHRVSHTSVAVRSPLAGDIRAAFVYGSIAKREDTVTSDIDLMVISDLTYADLFSVFEARRGFDLRV